MEPNLQNQDVKDRELWKLAKKRAGFKRHLYIYLVINLFLWAVWYFISGGYHYRSVFPWPAWTTMGWGLGLAFHYAGTYVFPESHSVEREYQKLKSKQSN